jgi:hypothetical protein
MEDGKIRRILDHAATPDSFTAVASHKGAHGIRMMARHRPVDGVSSIMVQADALRDRTRNRDPCPARSPCAEPTP